MGTSAVEFGPVYKTESYQSGRVRCAATCDQISHSQPPHIELHATPASAGIPNGYMKTKLLYLRTVWDFPGHPVIKTLHFHCRERGFDPWLGN